MMNMIRNWILLFWDLLRCYKFMNGLVTGVHRYSLSQNSHLELSKSGC
ncbi:hypothetical protein HanXRQr2_Chr14g0665971 [Helianthus annuus]|uniref:Uncharacterized protein n=1 Tax=Helianthus annuus TaxID=4232 RepID=A0A9K3ED93_HELAN|nr:hypothetical protein HanXRQr2_Chr14g0665971 [Helianthus annuus]KAJ0842213.1 hypothetical protein HanPSC8_Chr14g0639081 [Helianthus annuus]